MRQIRQETVRFRWALLDVVSTRLAVGGSARGQKGERESLWRMQVQCWRRDGWGPTYKHHHPPIPHPHRVDAHPASRTKLQHAAETADGPGLASAATRFKLGLGVLCALAAAEVDYWVGGSGQALVHV